MLKRMAIGVSLTTRPLPSVGEGRASPVLVEEPGTAGDTGVGMEAS